MTADAKRVFYLLRTMLDWLPPAPVSIRRQATGEVESDTKACPACSGKGRVTKRALECQHCAGRGFVATDAYTQREVGTSERVVVRMRTTRCDGCAGQGVHGNGKRCAWCEGSGSRQHPEQPDVQLEHLEAQLRIREGAEAEDPAAEWEARKLRHYRQGSYSAAEVALDSLAREDPEAAKVLTRFVVNGEEVKLSPSTALLLVSGLERMATFMAKPIRVPEWARVERQANGKGRWANQKAQGQRNEEIRRLRNAEGYSLSRIGREFGLTKQAVQYVLRRAS